MSTQLSFSPADQAFVQAHLNEDATRLLLKLPPAQRWLAQQVMARQKIKTKLPTWYNNPAVLFPVSLSLEQSSSEITAQHKASLISGKLLIDATGGMGVDAYYFAKQFEKVIYIEQKPELVQLARYNFNQLGATNIDCVCGEAMSLLKDFTKQIDWLYLDPARRSTTNQRVHQLADCEPDIVNNLELLFSKTNNIFTKTAPLLDIKQAIEDLQSVQNIHVVAIENECKEVLFELTKIPDGRIKLQTKNFKQITQSFNFDLKTEQEAVARFGTPLTFLYEPNAAILKAGAFKSIGNQFELLKIAAHSHLYTSTELHNDFPGRIFKIIDTVKANSQDIEPYLNDRKANLTVRNFPIGAEELRKKLKLKDGGNVYLFATTLHNNDKRVVIGHKL